MIERREVVSAPDAVIRVTRLVLTLEYRVRLAARLAEGAGRYCSERSADLCVSEIQATSHRNDGSDTSRESARLEV